MRRLGLIGGTSWVSSAHYYRALNVGVAAAKGGNASAPVTLWSVEFGEFARMQHDGDWTGVSRVLCHAARCLVDAGCEGVALAANTTHLVADDVRRAIVDVPLLDLVDLTAREVADRGAVGLLGTAFTMQSPMFADRLSRDGTHVLVPTDAAQQRVHQVIYDELTRDVVTDEARRDYAETIAKLVADGAEAVLLACTELAMLRLDDPALGVDVPLVDTTDVHCRALVEFMLGDPEGNPR